MAAVGCLQVLIAGPADRRWDHSMIPEHTCAEGENALDRLWWWRLCSCLPTGPAAKGPATRGGTGPALGAGHDPEKALWS